MSTGCFSVYLSYELSIYWYKRYLCLLKHLGGYNVKDHQEAFDEGGS